MRSWATGEWDTTTQDSQDAASPNTLHDVSEHEPVPPPPPPNSAPPPPPPLEPPNPHEPATSSVGVPAPDNDVRRDNPIAVAALVVSALALVLSIIVIGGLIGVIAIVMAGAAIRRSKISGQGKGLALSAIAISVFSIIASAGALTIIVSTLRGDDVVRNGIVSSSDNTEFPPQDDIVAVDCTEEGGIPLALITVENHSPEDSIYTLTITWDAETEEGTEEITEILRASEALPEGEQNVFRFFQRASGTVSDSCAVMRIERTSFSLG